MFGRVGKMISTSLLEISAPNMHEINQNLAGGGRACTARSGLTCSMLNLTADGSIATLRVPHLSPTSARSVLTVAQLASTDLPTFVDLVTRENGSRYPESGELLALQLLSDANGLISLSPFGLSTIRKTILGLYRGAELVAFTVVTEKVGGTIKFGPSAVLPSLRGRGLAGILRRRTEDIFRAAGSVLAYSTCQRTNIAVRRYLRKAGYFEIASLRDHYSQGTLELVYAKWLRTVAQGDLSVANQGITAVTSSSIKRGGALKIECEYGVGKRVLSIEALEAQLADCGAFGSRRSYLHAPHSADTDEVLRRLGYLPESQGFANTVVYGLNTINA
jgi:GNAT superfamily N-acetyltransferase